MDLAGTSRFAEWKEIWQNPPWDPREPEMCPFVKEHFLLCHGLPSQPFISISLIMHTGLWNLFLCQTVVWVFFPWRFGIKKMGMLLLPWPITSLGLPKCKHPNHHKLVCYINPGLKDLLLSNICYWNKCVLLFVVFLLTGSLPPPPPFSFLPPSIHSVQTQPREKV